MGIVVAVLGMHRSGTSCVTQMLAHCGMRLGNELPAPELAGQPSNLSGCFEARTAVEINDEILAASGGSWHSPPTQVQAGADLLGRMRQFLESLGNDGVAGWKDPRTTLTFGVWKPALKSYRVVACLRNPLNVAQSLEVRDGMPVAAGLELWYQYNLRLKQIAEREPEILWFDFDQPAAWIDHWLKQSCNLLGLAYRRQPKPVFIEAERHHHATELPDGPLKDLYLELWHKAHVASVRSQRQPSFEAREPSHADPVGKLIALENRIAQLTEMLSKQNVIAQRQQRQLDALYRVIDGDLPAVLDSLCEQLNANTQEPLARLDERIAALHQTIARLGTRTSWGQRLGQIFARDRSPVGGDQGAGSDSTANSIESKLWG